MGHSEVTMPSNFVALIRERNRRTRYTMPRPERKRIEYPVQHLYSGTSVPYTLRVP